MMLFILFIFVYCFMYKLGRWLLGWILHIIGSMTFITRYVVWALIVSNNVWWPKNAKSCIIRCLVDIYTIGHNIIPLLFNLYINFNLSMLTTLKNPTLYLLKSPTNHVRISGPNIIETNKKICIGLLLYCLLCALTIRYLFNRCFSSVSWWVLSLSAF